MNNDLINKVRELYDETKEREWNRLVKDCFHQIEFRVTMHLLRKYLPKSGRILDAGGGPGRYSIELCKMGYDTVLYDLSPGNIMLAIENINNEDSRVKKQMKGFQTGDIRDMSRFRDGEFDAVVCLGGPLSHVYKIEDIKKSISEIRRVTKNGGVIFASVMGRLAVLRTIMKYYSDDIIDKKLFNKNKNGTVYFKDTVPVRFFRRNEIVDLMENGGLTTLAVAGCEGLSAALQEATNQLAENNEKWEEWMDLILETCTEESVADMSEHILYVGRKD